MGTARLNFLILILLPSFHLLLSLPKTLQTNRVFFSPQQDDNQSGIHFTAKRERHQSGSSSNSIHSIAGTLSRVNTVASALKRFLSRDEGRSVGTPEAPPARSVSQLNINNTKPLPPVGSMKITDQVIMEVDEQMTIQSHKLDIRPTAQSIFAPQTAPIEMANAGERLYNRAFSTGLPIDHTAVLPPGGVDALLSASAPAPAPDALSTSEFTPILEHGIRVSYGSQDSREEVGGEVLDFNLQVDEFELLKARREQERIDRQKDLLSRSISTVPTQISTPLDTDLLIENLAAISSEQKLQQQQQQQEPPTPPSTADGQS